MRKRRIKTKAAIYLLLNNNIWLWGQDLLKTIQLQCGYEVVARAGITQDPKVSFWI